MGITSLCYPDTVPCTIQLQAIVNYKINKDTVLYYGAKVKSIWRGRYTKWAMLFSLILYLKKTLSCMAVPIRRQSLANLINTSIIRLLP